MKITAHFDSSDSADFAAGELKRALSPLASISTNSSPEVSDNLSINLFPLFNPMSTSTFFAVPVNSSNFTADVHKKDYQKSEHILEVVCRKDDYPNVSKIIINHGGRNISKL